MVLAILKTLYNRPMSDWSVYMLRCRNGALYTGISTDVPRRVREHIAGGDKAARYTRQFAPVRLVYDMMIGEMSLALKVERHIKRLPKRKKELIVAESLSHQALFDLLKISP